MRGQLTKVRGRFANVCGRHSVLFCMFSLFHSLKLFSAKICFSNLKCAVSAWPVSESEWLVSKCAWPSLKMFSLFVYFR